MSKIANSVQENMTLEPLGGWLARAPNVMWVPKNSIFDSFRSLAPKTSSCARKPVVYDIDV